MHVCTNTCTASTSGKLALVVKTLPLGVIQMYFLLCFIWTFDFYIWPSFYLPHSNSNHQIKFIYIALLTSADISKCCTETQPKTPNSKQCRCRSTVARKNSLERPKPRKKPREEPGYVGWSVFFWLCPGRDFNRTWPRCSNVPRWPAGSKQLKLE